MKSRKPIIWVGSSKKDLLALPKNIQRLIGYSINLAQQGKKDDDAKPFKGYGGCSLLEVVKNDENGAYRALYTVKFKEAIYILHVFQKKSKTGIKTPKQELELIEKRYREAHLLHEMVEMK